MGTEMIAMAKDTFERKQRRCAEELDEPNLFSNAPQLSLEVVATPLAGHVFCEGDEYRLAFVGEALSVISGVTIVGSIEAPPPSVVDTMHGPSPSTLGTVTSVFSLTGQATLRLE